jgi:hypothetical protein
MTNVKVKALDHFQHGRVAAARGGEYNFSKGDADDLVKAGLVELVGESDKDDDARVKQMPQPGDVVADEEEGILGSKMDQQPHNKMAEAPVNKSRAKKQ